MLNYNDLDDDDSAASDDLASSVGMQPGTSSSPAAATTAPPAPTMAPAPGAAPMAAPASAPAPISPVIQQYLAQKQQLSDAQGQASSNQLYAGLARSFGNLSAGIAGAKPLDQSGFNALDASAQQPVTDIQNAQKSQSVDLANQQSALAADKMQKSEDPNSPESVAAKTLIQKLYPGKFTADQLAPLSASDVGDSIMKPLELDQKIQEAKQASADKLFDRREGISDKASEKATTAQSKEYDLTRALLESARGNPAAAQAEKDIYASQKANTLVSMYGDPNQMSMPQVKLLAAEIGKIASGGQSSEAELEGITPNTLSGKLSNFVTNLTNDPTPANAAAFVKQYKDYADGVTKDAQKVIADKYGRVIESAKSKLAPDDYQNFKSLYIDRFNPNGPTASKSAPASGQSPDLQSSVAAEIAKRQSAKASQSQVVAPSQFGVGAPVDPTSVVPANSYAYGGFVGGLPASNFSASQAMKIPKAPAIHLPSVSRFDQGGIVPGKPQFNHNDPRNDVVPAMVSKGEMVLPLSVTQSKDPAMAAYLFMKQKMKGQ